MTYVMYLQESQKSNVITPAPAEIVGFDPATGGFAGMGGMGGSSSDEAIEEDSEPAGSEELDDTEAADEGASGN